MHLRDPVLGEKYQYYQYYRLRLGVSYFFEIFSLNSLLILATSQPRVSYFFTDFLKFAKIESITNCK